MNNDFTCEQMVEYFKGCSDLYLMSTMFKENIYGQTVEEWERTEKWHMIGWFSAQTTHGKGSYTREKTNNSAKVCYNRLQCPEALLWIAEACGVNEETVGEALDNLIGVAGNQKQCKAIRDVIPWETVYNAVKDKIK